MNENCETDINELYEKYLEDNQTRKILEILKECKNLEEAVVRVESLLKK